MCEVRDKKEQEGVMKAVLLQEGKKKFEKQTAKFCMSQERYLNLSTKKQDAVLKEVSTYRYSRNDQQYALICTTPLFYILAPTCFGSSLPSSGSFLDPSGLPWWFHGTTVIRHTGHVITHYMIYHPLDLHFK
jgi:hypothetical protein